MPTARSAHNDTPDSADACRRVPVAKTTPGRQTRSRIGVTATWHGQQSTSPTLWDYPRPQGLVVHVWTANLTLPPLGIPPRHAEEDVNNLLCPFTRPVSVSTPAGRSHFDRVGFHRPRLFPTCLKSSVAERVAPEKKIREIETIDEIPKSPSGKILRRTLVEEHVEGRDDSARLGEPDTP